MKFAAVVAKATLSTKGMNYLEEQAVLDELNLDWERHIRDMKQLDENMREGEIERVCVLVCRRE